MVALATDLGRLGFGSIVIVDDGSGPRYENVFQQCLAVPGVRVLRHEKNLGKGAALKTGIQYVLESPAGCTGIVTADADGQHLPEDIAAIADEMDRRPGCL